jgi:Xaa-Pro aminopeptidase
MIMQTMQPTLRNGRSVWSPINMPLEEFQDRIDTLRVKMADHRINVLLAYGYAFNHYGNPCYLSNYVIRLPRGALVALTPGDIALFFEGASRGLPSAKKLTWIEDVRPCPDISKECVKYLQEKSLTGSRIGLAGLDQWMPNDQRQFLDHALKECTLVDVQPLLGDMRMIKSEKELDQIRRASRIVKEIFEKLESTPLPSRVERILEATIIKAARLEGAEDIRVLFGRPRQKRWALRTAGQGSLSAGESLIIYLALVYERYWSEAVRTFRVEDHILKTPDPEGWQTFHEELIGGLKPGKDLTDCRRDLLAGIEKHAAGFISGYGLGQGIGLSPEEGPWLDETATGRLQSGMCLTLHPCIRDPDMGAVMIGNTVAVSQSGVEVLTA